MRSLRGSGGSGALVTLVLLLLVGGIASDCARTRRTFGLVLHRHPDVIYSVDTDAAAVALTLDDGPDPATTPAILDLLEQSDARATFFLLASRVEGNEALVASIVDRGHEIGNHGRRDVPAIELGPEEFEADLLQSHQLLSRWSVPRWYRPGSGWYDQPMLDILARHGYGCALGSTYPLDAQVPSIRFALRWLRSSVDPGDVIVLHDGGERGERTLEVLEVLLPELSERGLQVLTLSELVALAREDESG